MKKFCIYAMMAAGMLASCSKDNVKENVINDNSIEQIKLGVQNSVSVTEGSRGLGALASTWNGETLKLIGVNKTQSSYIFENEEVTAPTGSASGALTFNQTYTYTAKDIFDFYGYFTDDATTTSLSTNLAEGYAIKVTLDGTQDIMAAKADPTADVTNASEPVTADKAYSAYSSRRGVVPSLKFNHLLSKLVFKAKASSTVSTPINITKIAINDVNEGTLTIIPGTTYAAQGLAAGEAKGDYILKGVNSDSELTTEEAVIGTNLLILPKTEYNVTISTKQGAKTAESTFKVKLPSDPFEAGKQYNVVFTLNGLEIINVNATMTDWVDGGDININDDDEPTI